MARTSKKARRTSPLNLPGAFELFTPSKQLVLKNIWIFGPLYAVALIFGIHNWIWSPRPGGEPPHWWNHAYGFGGSLAGSPLPTYSTAALVGFSFLWILFVFVVGTITSVMTQSAQLKAVESKHLDFQDLWQTVKELGIRLLGLYIVLTVVIVIGLFLLIIPGLIFIRRYFLAPYVMLDQKLGIRESMDVSAELSKKNTGSIWGVIGVMFLIGFIGIVPFIGGIISFVLGCLYSIAPAMRYHQLKKLSV